MKRQGFFEIMFIAKVLSAEWVNVLPLRGVTENEQPKDTIEKIKNLETEKKTLLLKLKN